MLKIYLIGFLTGSLALLWLLLCGAGLLVERVRPIERRQPAGAVVFNLAYAILYAWALYGLAPITGILSVAIVNRLGGGILRLPGGGRGLLWAIPAYLLAMDLAEYLFHRAQHRWRPLWAMHSLHHSERVFNVTTTLRHFWVEAAIKAVFLYPIVGLVFKPSAAVAVAYFAGSYWNFVAHMNLRLSFGRLWPLLTGPHYHRVHHAASETYLNRNFAALFPVYDVIFGTCHRPQPDEYPQVGLPDGETPANLLEAILWPLRRRLRPKYPVIASAAKQVRRACVSRPRRVADGRGTDRPRPAR